MDGSHRRTRSHTQRVGPVRGWFFILNSIELLSICRISPVIELVTLYVTRLRLTVNSGGGGAFDGTDVGGGFGVVLEIGLVSTGSV